MIYLVPLLTANLDQHVDGDFKVVRVERKEAYAGKLGRRVSETLTVERDGVTYTVKLHEYHTALNRRARDYREGETIRLRGDIHGNQIDAR